MNTWLSIMIFFFSSPPGKPLEIKYEIGSTDEIRLYTDNSGALVLKETALDKFTRVNSDFSDTAIPPVDPTYKELAMEQCIEHTGADAPPLKDINKYDALSGCMYYITRNTTDYKYTLHKTCGQGHTITDLSGDKAPPVELEWAMLDVDKDGVEEIILNYQYIRGGGKGYSDFVTVLSVE